MNQLFEKIESYLEDHIKDIKFGSILLIVYVLIFLFVIALALLTISLASCFHFAVLLGVFVFSGVILAFFDFYKKKKPEFMKKISDFIKNYPLTRRFLKLFRRVCVLIITVSLISFVFGENTKALADHIVQQHFPPSVVEFGNKVKSLVTGQPDTTESNQSVVLEDELNDDSDYQVDSFRIVNPNAEYSVEQFMNQLFRGPESAIREMQLGLYLRDNFYDLFSSCDSSTDFDCDTELNKIALLETDFLNRIDLAAPYMESDVVKWYNMLPTSDDLDEIIWLREDLVSRGYKCYTIFNRLSNDYQEYALEFYHLNENPDAILYYYCKSIEADMLALSYATSRQEMNTCLRRIQIRYQDIYTSAIIDESIREIAKAVSIQIAIDCGFDYSAIG